LLLPAWLPRRHCPNTPHLRAYRCGTRKCYYILCLKASCVQDVVNGAKKRQAIEFLSADKISHHDFLTQEDAGDIAGRGGADSGRFKA
jgi:hypothetical protein